MIFIDFSLSLLEEGTHEHRNSGGAINPISNELPVGLFFRSV